MAVFSLAGCDPQPRLQSAGAWNPVCLFFCRAVQTSADIEGTGDVTDTVDVGGSDQ